MAATSNASAGPPLQLLRLSSAGEQLTVGIEGVREILEVGRMTAMPQTPDFVHGVMNLRGSVVPVIDLSARFGSGRTVLGRRSAIVVVETSNNEQHERLIAGLLVDAVYEVVNVGSEAVEPVPSLGVAIPTDFLSGMVNLGGKYAPLLNLNLLLAPDRLAQLIGDHQP
ncbi:chemotaxis protein CheW [Paucibacter sp. APW11]|uniref:Chemotaxis protein CheW n=1 Tax=Roseateles aquae TaxID=3077235 RepID=A0ABU3PGP9_9BURK|nr:chemotaxis protein CheW [Paucibacter sp. APW11]MDT9001718.1 chemotaxis protein CheW [Paucibacter sp. APW11]